MNKSDLIDALTIRMNIPSREAGDIVSTLLLTMTDALVNGDDIQIRGFGSFSIREYDGYEGRNPKTGEKREVKPKKLPFFKVGKELKDRMNEGKQGVTIDRKYIDFGLDE